MSSTKLDYAAALSANDKRGIVELDARAALDLARVSEFPNLTSLDLADNKRITDFSFLRALPQLRELYLSGLGLTAIPAEVASLKQLETLFIGDNEIKDFGLLGELPALVDLGLEALGLRKVPDEVLRISALRVLGLHGNSLTSLTALKKLTALEELYVGENNLKKLPKELAKLPLRKLDISGNYPLADWSVLDQLVGLEELTMTNSHEIPSLPAGIFGLTSLKSLTLGIHWNAPADALPGLDTIDRLTQLEDLTISGSSITRLPAAFGALLKLERLDLKDNKQLQDITALRELPALRELDLSKCDLRSVPEPFTTLKALKELDLSHNDHLTEIPGLAELPALEKLVLYSKLSTLPQSLGTLTSLKVLELSARADDVSFLSRLEQLEELYLANCTFDALPPGLSKLRKLTVSSETAPKDDSYLARYKGLEELSVTQPSFVLPRLPSVRKLSIGRVTHTLDLTNLAALPALEELSIHRSITLAQLPEALATAPALKVLTLEFLDSLTDLSALAGLATLRQLSLRYCPLLEVFPPSLASLTALELLRCYSVGARDITAVGELKELRELDLERVARLSALPPSLQHCSKLERVRLRDLEGLTDIAVLERLPSLRELDCEDCRKLPRKAIAAVQNAIAARAPTARALEMSYQQFIATRHYAKLRAQEDRQRTYPFPLWFALPARLRKAMEDFSWLDDYRDCEEGGADAELTAILEDPDSALQPLALLDLGYEGTDDTMIDAYAEEIFLVDTQDAKNPVLIWGHDGRPTRIHETFDDFLASLRDFSPPA